MDATEITTDPCVGYDTHRVKSQGMQVETGFTGVESVQPCILALSGRHGSNGGRASLYGGIVLDKRARNQSFRVRRF